MNCRGFSYVEVLVATTLVAVALIPAIQSLSPALSATQIHREQTVDYFHLLELMEYVLAQPYNQLLNAAGDQTVPSRYSDNITATDGRNLIRQVFISTYDADNNDNDNDPFTGTDDGLLWVRVSIDGTMPAMETVVRQ